MKFLEAQRQAKMNRESIEDKMLPGPEGTDLKASKKGKKGRTAPEGASPVTSHVSAAPPAPQTPETASEAPASEPALGRVFEAEVGDVMRLEDSHGD